MANGMGQGLAAESAASQVGVQEVVAMLMQGMDPEQLMQRGVPIEIIREAIQMIMAQEQQAQTTAQPPVTDAGLAATQIR